MKTWFVRNFRTLILVGLLVVALILTILKWYTLLVIFVSILTIFGVLLLTFSLLESASDDKPVPLIDFRVLKKYPDIADIEKLKLQYQRETGKTRPEHLKRSTPDSLDYMSWVEHLATQMLLLREHLDNEKR